MTYQFKIKQAILLLLLALAIIPNTAIAFPHHHREARTEQVTPDAVLHYVNKFREGHGLKALKMNSAMSAEAEKHSRDMAKHNVPFGHEGFDGRAKRLGREITMTAIAENVAMGELSAQSAVDLWIHSPGHRRNMLGNYGLTGIGIASDRQGNLYFTQIFINNK